MTLPKVSIITPSLNQGRFIEQALQSVADQDYRPIEHIIIDGGSCDQTPEILHRHDKHISAWISESDSGTSEAINKGFAMASGDLIWMLNSDDLLVGTSAISTLVAFMTQHPDVDFVYGDMQIVDEKGHQIGVRKFTDYDIDTLLMDRRNLPFPGCLMKRSILEKTGGFDESLRYANDLDFFLRIALSGKLTHIPVITGALRIHHQASTQTNVAGIGDESRRVCNHYLKLAEEEKRLRHPVAQIQSEIASFGASCSFHSGKARDVQRFVAAAFKKWPPQKRNVKLWIYLTSSLMGDKKMLQISRVTRKLLKLPACYAVNNFLSAL